MDLTLNLMDNSINNANELSFSNQLLNKFIDYSDVRECTIKNYRVDIKPFFDFLKDKNITQPTRKDIKLYKEYLNNSELATGTKQQYLKTCKHLFKWLYSEGLYPNIADNIKGFKVDSSKTKKESFNEQDIKTILNSIDTSTLIGKRDYAIILLMVIGGLRINEVRNIDLKDIQVIKGQCVVYILGKGHDEKDDYIKLIPAVYKAIKEYVDSKPVKTNILFTSTSNRALNKRISRETMSQIIKDRFRQAGYDSDKLTPHSLRHTSNTLLFNSGADLYKVQQHARHKDPKTTEIYLHSYKRDLDTSEQDIYNQIFNTANQDITNDLKASISELNIAEQEQVLNFIKQLKEGALN